jgi:hypothetical protein
MLQGDIPADRSWADRASDTGVGPQAKNSADREEFIQMRGFGRASNWSCFGLALGLLLLPTSQLRADISLDGIGLYDGTSNAPTAYISFTGSNGYVDVYADPQTATNWTSNGSSLALYCTDTTHENSLGDTYTVNAVSSLPLTSTPTYSDAGNRIAWALEQTASTADARGAVQLLVWQIVDKQFNVNWSATNNSGLQAAYTLLAGQMQSQYNSNFNYQAGVEFLAANHDGDLYQNIAVMTPEPSALITVTLGASGLIGFALLRRRRAAS